MLESLFPKSSDHHATLTLDQTLHEGKGLVRPSLSREVRRTSVRTCSMDDWRIFRVLLRVNQDSSSMKAQKSMPNREMSATRTNSEETHTEVSAIEREDPLRSLLTVSEGTANWSQGPISNWWWEYQRVVCSFYAVEGKAPVSLILYCLPDMFW